MTSIVSTTAALSPSSSSAAAYEEESRGQQRQLPEAIAIERQQAERDQQLYQEQLQELVPLNDDAPPKSAPAAPNGALVPVAPEIENKQPRPASSDERKQTSQMRLIERLGALNEQLRSESRRTQRQLNTVLQEHGQLLMRLEKMNDQLLPYRYYHHTSGAAADEDPLQGEAGQRQHPLTSRLLSSLFILEESADVAAANGPQQRESEQEQNLINSINAIDSVPLLRRLLLQAVLRQWSCESVLVASAGSSSSNCAATSTPVSSGSRTYSFAREGSSRNTSSSGFSGNYTSAAGGELGNRGLTRAERAAVVAGRLAPTPTRSHNQFQEPFSSTSSSSKREGDGGRVTTPTNATHEGYERQVSQPHVMKQVQQLRQQSATRRRAAGNTGTAAATNTAVAPPLTAPAPSPSTYEDLQLQQHHPPTTAAFTSSYKRIGSTPTADDGSNRGRASSSSNHNVRRWTSANQPVHDVTPTSTATADTPAGPTTYGTNTTPTAAAVNSDEGTTLSPTASTPAPNASYGTTEISTTSTTDNTSTATASFQRNDSSKRKITPDGNGMSSRALDPNTTVLTTEGYTTPIKANSAKITTPRAATDATSAAPPVATGEAGSTHPIRAAPQPASANRAAILQQQGGNPATPGRGRRPVERAAVLQQSSPAFRRTFSGSGGGGGSAAARKAKPTAPSSARQTPQQQQPQLPHPNTFIGNNQIQRLYSRTNSGSSGAGTPRPTR